jgi:DNA-binding NarL/FixJ family response regulator
LATKAFDASAPGTLRARSLLLLGTLATYTDTIQDRVAFQEYALAEAGDDPGLRIRILLALFEQIGSDAGKAARRADEAIELLREQDDRSLLAPALVRKLVAQALLGRGAQTELLDDALRIEAESGPVPDKYPLLWFHWIDDLAATRERYRHHEQEYRDRGDTVGTAEIAEFLAMPEFRAGRWDVAEELLEEACATLAELDVRGPAAASLADRSVIDAHRGRIERAHRTLGGILEDGRLDVMWRMVCHSALGAVEFCAGDSEAADRAWASMRAEAGQIAWYDNLEDRSEPDHVEALLALGRLEDARRILEHLEWRARTLPRAWINATLPRARALVLAGEGQLGAALEMLDAAPEVVALPFERARLLMVRGQVARRANRKLAARDVLTEALAIFEALGSPPWAARARAEIERLGLRHRGPDELTDGERRIAELAAGGLTNRQIAEAAFVSPKTVESNLARVYQKLGIRSRAELGARMATRLGSVRTEE